MAHRLVLAQPVKSFPAATEEWGEEAERFFSAFPLNHTSGAISESREH